MNYSLFKLINGFAGKSEVLDQAMIILSKSAIIIAIGLVMYLWFLNKNERKYTAFYIGLTLILALGSNYIIHAFYYHPRPFISHHVVKLISHSSDSSFVSDHGTLVFSIAFILLMRKDRLAKFTLLWAILVGLSRIYVGVHYPLDIIGAIILSGITSLVVIKTASLTNPIMKILMKLNEFIVRKVPFLNNKELKSLD
ncbi:undecaprenyl-diphosphatase [Bacillus sp. EAC]|uniref:undecaprenyl-diphosphatase n=1 Tax=Bacillus sp. EAC TaxID=1978338 RepID=UPI000B44FD2A|nr:undecaprenyl-diphosphatase [Bacillus sp. EAC]